MRDWHQIKVLQNTAENLTAQAFCGQCCSVSEMVTDGTRNSRSGIHGPLSLLRYKNALSFKKCFANCEKGSEWETTPKAPKHFCLNTQGCLETILWMIKQKNNLFHLLNASSYKHRKNRLLKPTIVFSSRNAEVAIHTFSPSHHHTNYVL